jgi:ribulose 1,5-bisphosphate synthetase/thiazole synthase
MGTPERPISIAIIGAGIAGITLCIALSQRNSNLKVTVFESRAAFSEIGAGVGKCFHTVCTFSAFLLSFHRLWTECCPSHDLDIS